MIARTRSQKPEPEELNATELGRCLTALADPTRQRIVRILSQERLNVGDLAGRFDLSRPAISHQLKVLSEARLLVQERQGQERVYRLDIGRCRQFLAAVRRFIANCCADANCC